MSIENLIVSFSSDVDHTLSGRDDTDIYSWTLTRGDKKFLLLVQNGVYTGIKVALAVCREGETKFKLSKILFEYRVK